MRTPRTREYFINTKELLKAFEVHITVVGKHSVISSVVPVFVHLSNKTKNSFSVLYDIYCFNLLADLLQIKSLAGF